MLRIESKTPVLWLVPWTSQLRVDAHPLLRGGRAREVGVELVLHDLPDAGAAVLDPGRLQQPGRPAHQQLDLVAERQAERVDVVGRDPLHVAVRRLGRELHRAGGHRRRHLRRADGRLGDADGGLGAEHDAGGEAPRAVEDHPHREADVLGVAGALQPPVADPDVLVADPLEPEVRVADVEVLGPGERGLGHLAVGQGGERVVDRVPGGHGVEAMTRGSLGDRRVRAAVQVRPSRSWASRRTLCSPIHLAGSTSNPASRAASRTRWSSSTSTTTVRVSASPRRASTL